MQNWYFTGTSRELWHAEEWEGTKWGKTVQMWKRGMVWVYILNHINVVFTEFKIKNSMFACYTCVYMLLMTIVY